MKTPEIGTLKLRRPLDVGEGTPPKPNPPPPPPPGAAPARKKKRFTYMDAVDELAREAVKDSEEKDMLRARVEQLTADNLLLKNRVQELQQQLQQATTVSVNDGWGALVAAGRA